MKLSIIYCLFYAVLFTTLAFSAPMPSWNPITIEGTVGEISWCPMETAKSNPGSWGSARHDRTFPAHYNVKLSDIVVPKKSHPLDPHYKNGDTIDIELNHEEDDGYLKRGMRIKVVDYRIGGDEGGTWTFFKSLEILY